MRAVSRADEGFHAQAGKMNSLGRGQLQIAYASR